MELRNKSVLITGASRGIGAAMARAFSRRGAKLILVARSLDDLEEVRRQCRGIGVSGCEIFSADLSDGKAARQISTEILNKLGCPDVLVNNAGAGQFKDISDTSIDELTSMTALPYFAAFNTTNVFAQAFHKRGTGFILNVTSPAALVPFPHSTAYSVARWAMRGFTEALKSDFSKTKVRVSLGMPGKVASSYWQANPGSEERIPAISKILPTLTEDQAGEILVRGIEKNKTLIIRPLLLRILYFFYQLMPETISAIVRKF
jgi:short-subunit dehydrogenase